MGKLLDSFIKTMSALTGEKPEQTFENRKVVVENKRTVQLAEAMRANLGNAFRTIHFMGMEESEKQLRECAPPEVAETVLREAREGMENSISWYFEDMHPAEYKNISAEYRKLPHETQRKMDLNQYLCEKMKDRITQEMRDSIYHASIMGKLFRVDKQAFGAYTARTIDMLTPEQEEQIVENWGMYENIATFPKDKMMVNPLQEEIRKAFDGEAMQKYLEEHSGEKEEVSELLAFAEDQMRSLSNEAFDQGKTQFSIVETGGTLLYHEGVRQIKTMDGGKYYKPDSYVKGALFSYKVVNKGREQDVKDLMTQEMVLDEKQKEGLRRILNKMRELELMKPGERFAGEMGVKLYAFKKYAEVRQELEQSVKKGDAASIVTLSREMKRQYDGIVEMMKIAKEFFNDDPNLFPGNLDSNRVRSLPPELTFQFKNSSMINGAFQIYAVLNANNTSIEEFLAHPCQTLQQEWLGNVREKSVDGLTAGKDLGGILEVLGNPNYAEELSRPENNNPMAFGRSMEMISVSGNDPANQVKYAILSTAKNDYASEVISREGQLLKVLWEGEPKLANSVLKNLLLAPDAYRKENLRSLISPVGVQFDGIPAGGFDREKYLDDAAQIDYRELMDHYQTMLASFRSLEKEIPEYEGPTAADVFRVGVQVFEQVLNRRFVKNDPNWSEFVQFVRNLAIPQECSEEETRRLGKLHQETLARFDEMTKNYAPNRRIPMEGQVPAEEMHLSVGVAGKVLTAAYRTMGLLGMHHIEGYFQSLYNKSLAAPMDSSHMISNPLGGGILQNVGLEYSDPAHRQELADGLGTLETVTGQYLAEHPDLEQSDPLRYTMLSSLHMLSEAILKGEDVSEMASVNPLLLGGLAGPTNIMNFSAEVKGELSQDTHYFKVYGMGVKLQELINEAGTIPAGDAEREQELRQRMLETIATIRREAGDSASALADEKSSEYQKIYQLANSEYQKKNISTNMDVVGDRGLQMMDGRMAGLEGYINQNWPLRMLPFQMYLENMQRVLGIYDPSEYAEQPEKMAALNDLQRLLGERDSAFENLNSANEFFGKFQGLVERLPEFMEEEGLKEFYDSHIGQVREYLAERNLDHGLNEYETNRTITGMGALFADSNRWYYWNSPQYGKLCDDLKEYAALQTVNGRPEGAMYRDAEQSCLRNIATDAESYLRKVIQEGRGMSENKIARTTAALAMLHRINPAAAMALVEANQELMRELLPSDMSDRMDVNLMDVILQNASAMSEGMSLQESFGNRLNVIRGKMTQFENRIQWTKAAYEVGDSGSYVGMFPLIASQTEHGVHLEAISGEECSALKYVAGAVGKADQMDELLAISMNRPIPTEQVAALLEEGFQYYAEALKGEHGNQLFEEDSQIRGKIYAEALELAEKNPVILEQMEGRLKPEDRDMIRAVGELVRLQEKALVAEGRLLEAARDAKELSKEDKRQILQDMVNYELVKEVGMANRTLGMPKIVLEMCHGAQEMIRTFGEAAKGDMIQMLSAKPVAELAGMNMEAVSRRLAQSAFQGAARIKGQEAMEKRQAQQRELGHQKQAGQEKQAGQTAQAQPQGPAPTA